MRRVIITLVLSWLISQALYPQHDRIVIVDRDITIPEYFSFLDSLARRYDSIFPIKMSEHLIVRNNPWIIDSLANTDYYRMMERDSFVYDQKKLIIFRVNDTIIIPGYERAMTLDSIFTRTHIDVNIPEFKLRIFLDNMMLYEFPVRVGQNRKRYLAMGERITNLKTKTGMGVIVRHNRNPDYFNPVDGKRFYTTRRDDDRVTLMPQIPWIETEINGVRNGQMIHPTTNPETLGKAYSNGCIGTTEADAWVIYYHAPIGTKMVIRYDVEVPVGNDQLIKLKDIYNLKKAHH